MADVGLAFPEGLAGVAQVPHDDLFEHLRRLAFREAHQVSVLRFGVQGLGSGVWGSGTGVWGLGFGVWGLGFGGWG